MIKGEIAYVYCCIFVLYMKVLRFQCSVLSEYPMLILSSFVVVSEAMIVYYHFMIQI
jgi:hypothetical protein